MDKRDKKKIITRSATYIAVFVVLFGGFFFVRHSPWQSGIMLHTAMEVIATLLALFIGIVALVRFYSKKTNIFLFIAIAFLGAGVLDGYHAAVTSPFFIDRFPSDLSLLMPWSWIAPRIFLSGFLFMSWFAWRREDFLGKKGRYAELQIYVLAGVLAIEIFLFFAFVPLRRGYFPNFPLPRPQEFFPAFLFLITLVGYLLKRSWQRDSFEHWLVLALIVNVVGQTFYMSFSQQLFDATFDMALLLKNLSYIFVLIGLIISMYHLFRQAEESKTLLSAQNRVLTREKARLEEAKAKDESILLAIGDGLVVVDRDGKIVLVNNAFEELLGWKFHEVLGRALSDVVLERNRKGRRVPQSKGVIPVVLASGKKVSAADYYYTRKDRTRFPVTVVAAPITLDSETIGAVEVFHDITKEKAIDRAKSEFVSLASHQLRTPLSTIKWYAEMLLEGDAKPLNSEQKRYLEEIYRGNERMIELVNALLNVSRIELGTLGIEPEPTAVPKLAESVLKELAPQIKEKELSIEKQYVRNLPNVSVDPRLMRIVFQNLLSNAVKYTPKRGKVALKIARENGNIRITVADTGYGIPQNQQHKIFTKLFRGDNVRLKDTTGTGLGLYITKAIIERFRGKIWFESKEGNGTTFHVTLPLKGVRPQKGSKGLVGSVY